MALAILLEHMHKECEINQTKIKDGCQPVRKGITHNSKGDLPLVWNLISLNFVIVGMSGDVNGIDSIELKAPKDVEQKLSSAGFSIVSKNETSYQVDDPDGARLNITSV